MLVGRGDQLAVLCALSLRARDGAGQAVLVEGEAGIGKSAILGAWAERCRDDGFLVLRGNGDELGATRPFAPLLDALGDGPAGDEARRAVRERMAQEPTAQLAVLDGDPGVQSLLIDDLVNRVEDLCITQPVGLFLDDVHWADASTVATLASLVRRASDLPLLVALATRPVPRSDYLVAFLDLLDVPSARLRVHRVELGPLGPDEVTALATEILENPPGPGLRGLLEGCAGNPLLVVEMLVSLRDAGLLASERGIVDTASNLATSGSRAR